MARRIEKTTAQKDLSKVIVWHYPLSTIKCGKIGLKSAPEHSSSSGKGRIDKTFTNNYLTEYRETMKLAKNTKRDIINCC